MTLLLDTHAFLWWIADDPRLSGAARDEIANAENEVWVSAASGWEIAIKAGLGRIELPTDPERFIPDQLARNDMTSLPVQMGHALRAAHLPNHHRDPVDRLLVAQAQAEAVPLVTRDPEIARYEVELLW